MNKKTKICIVLKLTLFIVVAFLYFIHTANWDISHIYVTYYEPKNIDLSVSVNLVIINIKIPLNIISN